MPRSRTFLILCAAHLLLLAACQTDSSSFRMDDVLFRDQFVAGDTGAWELEGDQVARVSVSNEQMIIEINAPQTLQFTTLAEPAFGDFVAEVDIIRLTGDLDNSAGILFRLQSPSEFYRFEITGSGLYIVERRDADGRWVRLIDDWQESNAIRQGLNVTNKLKVVAIGPAFAFYVNDQLLLETQDNAFATGKIALDAGTFGRAGSQVAFDNVQVARP